MEPMDRDTVEAARAGDREAFADLIRVRIDRLYVLAHRMLRDVERGEDALQDALVTAWRDLPGLRDAERFDAWLYRIVVRSCVLEAAKERRRFSNLRIMPLDVAMPGDDFRAVADRDQLERGFRRLPQNSGHCSCSATSRVVTRRRSPRSSAYRSERLARGSITAYRAMRAALDADARVIAIGGRPA